MKVLLGGRDKVAIICDCDSSWSMIRLDKLIKAHLLARIKQVLSLPPISAVPLDLSPSITSVLKSALSRIHIFKPTSTMSLATTLLTLPTYHSHELPNSEISMLLIDGISSFHWADKSHSEELKSNTNTSKPKSVISPDGRTLPPLPRADTNPLHHVLTSIQKLRTTLGIITILTNWGLYPIDANKPSHSTDLSQQQAGGTSHFFRQHLPPPWPSPFDTGPPPSSYYSSQYNPSSTQVPMRRTTIIPLTHHITLPLPPIPPFSPATTLGEALGDTERKEAVKDHFITAVVRTIGTPEEGGPMRTLVGSFEFGITEDRVLVE
jgi:DNA-repair protein XRCC2